MLRAIAVLALTCVLWAISGWAHGQATRVYPPGERPKDTRLGPLKDLNGYFPFRVPPSREAWEERADQLRRQVLLATGLWPNFMERTPLEPVIHGLVERDGFTVEKVYFQSLPNHYVTGLLFRPRDGRQGALRPGVLCPHGHGGRMQDYGAENMAKLIESGAEKFERSGRFPKLARCAQLARMGCVCFIFDMLGYEDSQQISEELAHRFRKQRPELQGPEQWGFYSAQAEMRLQSMMGLQTWNSIRALDFLEQLPDVDPSRLAVTGGSGGGTQTILLCAIDERPIAAFPNGMVSTAMQGGCTCENCSLLRVGTGNVELAALFAPKPQAMTAADDWTKEMMTKGYPQLQELYALLGAPQNVYCRPLLQFPHNYNYVSRQTMYEWFNQHLDLGLANLDEVDFEPLTPEEASVWNEDHPAPQGGLEYELALTKYLTEQSDRAIDGLVPHDQQTLERYQDLIGGAFQGIIGRGLPGPNEVTRQKISKQEQADYFFFRDILRLESLGEELPVVSWFPKQADWNGQVVIWIHGQGKAGLLEDQGHPQQEVLDLLANGACVISADLFQQGEFLDSELSKLNLQRTVDNPREAPCYTFAYNPSLFAQRVHDVLTLISFVTNDEYRPTQIGLVGTDGAGPVAAMARLIAGQTVDRAVFDTQGFRFAAITDYRDANFLPGSVKYGDLPAILGLNAPHATQLIGESAIPQLTARIFDAAEAGSKIVLKPHMDIAWLLAE